MGPWVYKQALAVRQSQTLVRSEVLIAFSAATRKVAMIRATGRVKLTRRFRFLSQVSCVLLVKCRVQLGFQEEGITQDSVDKEGHKESLDGQDQPFHAFRNTLEDQ
jgi:hypothetical protein